MDKGKRIALAIWSLIILACGSMVYRWYWAPSTKKAAEQRQQQEEQTVKAATSSTSAYKNTVRFGLDTFSGYAILRSQEMQNSLRRKSIKAELVSDNADYVARLKALKSGDLDMAAFTVDALITASAAIKDTPATIIALIDETRGADLAVGYSAKFPNVDSLNDPEVKFVLTDNSPSKTLILVALANFQFDQISKDPFIFVNGAKEVFEHYRKSKDTDKNVYVVWQPYGTKILENPNTHAIIDSSRFRGYLIDVIVANRDFLYKKPDVAKHYIEAYLNAVYTHKDNFVKVVSEDASNLGEPLSPKQAEDLVSGLWFKNTQENYGHFGYGNQSLQHIEDMIANITKVLVKTGAINNDPTNGNASLLFYDGIIKSLSEAGFHPGFAVEDVRSEAVELPALTDEQWASLVPIGTLEVPKLVFARGTAKLNEVSKGRLDELYEKLVTFPTYYVIIKAGTAGDDEFALSRAKSAEEYLVEKGVSQNRIHSTVGDKTKETTVNFVLGESRY